MGRAKTISTLALLLTLTSVGQAAAQGSRSGDPGAKSPSGAIYEIPLDRARDDAAPSGRSGGTERSRVHGDDGGFGSSNTVPGADPGAATQGDGETQTPAEADSGAGDTGAGSGSGSGGSGSGGGATGSGPGGSTSGEASGSGAGASVSGGPFGGGDDAGLSLLLLGSAAAIGAGLGAMALRARRTTN